MMDAIKFMMKPRFWVMLSKFSINWKSMWETLFLKHVIDNKFLAKSPHHFSWKWICWHVHFFHFTSLSIFKLSNCIIYLTPFILTIVVYCSSVLIGRLSLRSNIFHLFSLNCFCNCSALMCCLSQLSWLS